MMKMDQEFTIPEMMLEDPFRFTCENWNPVWFGIKKDIELNPANYRGKTKPSTYDMLKGLKKIKSDYSLDLVDVTRISRCISKANTRDATASMIFRKMGCGMFKKGDFDMYPSAFETSLTLSNIPSLISPTEPVRNDESPDNSIPPKKITNKAKFLVDNWHSGGYTKKVDIFNHMKKIYPDSDSLTMSDVVLVGNMINSAAYKDEIASYLLQVLCDGNVFTSIRAAYTIYLRAKKTPCFDPMKLEKDVIDSLISEYIYNMSIYGGKFKEEGLIGPDAEKFMNEHPIRTVKRVEIKKITPVVTNEHVIKQSSDEYSKVKFLCDNWKDLRSGANTCIHLYENANKIKPSGMDLTQGDISQLNILINKATIDKNAEYLLEKIYSGNVIKSITGAYKIYRKVSKGIMDYQPDQLKKEIIDEHILKYIINIFESQTTEIINFLGKDARKVYDEYRKKNIKANTLIPDTITPTVGPNTNTFIGKRVIIDINTPQQVETIRKIWEILKNNYETIDDLLAFYTHLREFKSVVPELEHPYLEVTQKMEN
jgi:hypothetical protein